MRSATGTSHPLAALYIYSNKMKINPSIVSRALVRTAEIQQRSIGEQWDVRRTKPLPTRLASIAWGLAIGAKPVQRYLLEQTLGDLSRYPVIGMGFQQIVVDAGDEVLKLRFTQTDCDSGEPISYIVDEMNENCDTMSAFLRDYWLGASYEAFDSPLLGEVVVARQAKIQPAQFVPHLLPMADIPGVSAEVHRDFAEASLTVHDATGLLPDMFGKNNIALRPQYGRRELTPVVVDNLPITTKEQAYVVPEYGTTIGMLTVQQLERWEAM